MDPLRRPLISLPLTNRALSPSPPRHGRPRHPLLIGFTVPARFRRHAILLSFLLGFICFGLLHSTGVVPQLGASKLRGAGGEKLEGGGRLSSSLEDSMGRDGDGRMEEKPSPEVLAAVAAAVEGARLTGDSEAAAAPHIEQESPERGAEAAAAVREGTSKGSGSPPVSVYTLPKHDAAFHPRPETRYMSYMPHSGYHNQRISLTNALLLSKALNLTLLLPPAFLSSHHPIPFFRPISELHSKLTSTVALRTTLAPFCSSPKNRVLSAAAASASSNRAGGSHKGGAGSRKKKDRCKDWTAQTLVSWEFLVSLDSLRSQGYSFASWWSLDDAELLSLYGVDKNDSMDMWLNDDRYDQQIHLTDNINLQPGPRPSSYTSQATLRQLAEKARGARHLGFGSLFGGERLVFPVEGEEVTEGKGLWDWERWEKERLIVKRALAIELDDGGLLKEVVDGTRDRLNGRVDVYPGGEGEDDLSSGYVGLHCRLSENPFALNSGITTRTMFHSLLVQHFALPPALASSLERTLWSSSSTWRELIANAFSVSLSSIGEDSDDEAEGSSPNPPALSRLPDGLTLYPGPPILQPLRTDSMPPSFVFPSSDDPSSTSQHDRASHPSSLKCSLPLHTNPLLAPLNIPIFIASDSPPTHPALEIFRNFFPCLFYLPDLLPPSSRSSTSSPFTSSQQASNLSSAYDRLRTLENASDGVQLFPFLVPFLDGLIAAGGRIVQGTPRSTMSSHIVHTEWRKAWGLEPLDAD